MSFDGNLTEFAGLPVVDFPTRAEEPLPETDGLCAWRLSVYMDGEPYVFDEIVADFLDRVDAEQVTALVIGVWSEYVGDPEDRNYPVGKLVEVADRLPALRALFLGDINSQDSDVAYIYHSDVSVILDAYPALEEFRVRGSVEWVPEGESPPVLFQPIKHDALRVLVFESGGLPAATMRAVGESELPELEHLEFFFGEPDYGGDATLADVAWLLAGDRLPKLRRLGLRDSPVQDEIAAAVAHAPVVAQLEVLDLSLGTLGDEGAAALLAGQPLGHLTTLDLHHHFVSDPMADRLRAALPTVDVVLGPAEEPWVHHRNGVRELQRYIAVAE
jgi:hypothetical protein